MKFFRKGGWGRKFTGLEIFPGSATILCRLFSTWHGDESKVGSAGQLSHKSIPHTILAWAATLIAVVKMWRGMLFLGEVVSANDK